MARIQDAKVKETSGGYERLFGISELARMISRTQSAVISAGTELERLILDRVEKIPDLDKFLGSEIMQEGVFVARKRVIKKSKAMGSSEFEPDLLVFKRRMDKQDCYVVELKDGHQFDTKKASAEYDAVHSFINRNGSKIPYRMKAYFCCFNQETREAIVTGFKKKIKIEDSMTGRELCELLEIDYDAIQQKRKKDQPANVQYFLSELVKIDKVRGILQGLLDRWRS